MVLHGVPSRSPARSEERIHPQSVAPCGKRARWKAHIVALPGVSVASTALILPDTSEGAPDYGPVVVSLTTSGDTSPASTLAVDRFPTANSNGRYTYTRKLQIGTDIPTSVANDLDDFHIVAHGIDTNHNGMYDFSKGKSDLNPALPQEATVPATCGLIK